MNIRIFLVFLSFLGAVYLLSVLGSSCAQILAPTGGPRDSLPPVLLNSTPENRTTNFTANRVTLSFDEYIQIQDLPKNLIVSPTPKLNPDINYKLKVVTIKIRDTLDANTTYVIDMGNAIQDINENNPYRNYRYVFSTGSYIDSMKFSGNIRLAETGKVDSTLIALLYNDLDDSAVLKKKPRYIARLDSSGNFSFSNLAPGTYNVYGLKDESSQKYYNNKTELFAFADSSINIEGTTTPIQLFAYAEEKPEQKSSPPPKPVAGKNLKFTASMTAGIQDLLAPITLSFENKLEEFDSSKILLTDTLFKPYQSVSVKLDSTGRKVSIDQPWQENTEYELVVPADFAADSLGNTLEKPDTIRFKTKKETDYGIIKLNFTNLDKFKHPVLQFISNNQLVNSFPLTSSHWEVKLFNPGEYEMRILDDTNGNGLWDPGNYELKLQPERAFSIPQKINIRANWENEKDILL